MTVRISKISVKKQRVKLLKLSMKNNHLCDKNIYIIITKAINVIYVCHVKIINLFRYGISKTTRLSVIFLIFQLYYHYNSI